jgi:HlyD family secretion protein
MKNSTILQRLKPLNRWTIALIVTAIAITGGSLYYSISKFGQKPAEPVAPAPTIEPITALGRLEPASEVVRVAAPATLNNDRVAQLLVKRGDRVQVGQEIAILDSRERLQTALVETQERVSTAQARLAQVKAGAKSGEIAAQQAEITRLEEELQGEIASQTAIIARRQSEVNVAQAEYNRYLMLYREGAIAASNLDQRRLTLETAQAQLNEVKSNRNRTADTLRAQINRARATLNQIAEVRPEDVRVAQTEVNQAIAAVKRAEAELKEASIRAPIAGQVWKFTPNPVRRSLTKVLLTWERLTQWKWLQKFTRVTLARFAAVNQRSLLVRGFLENCGEQFAKLGCKSASKKSSAISPDRTSIAVSLRSEFASIQRIVNKWQA